MNLHAIGIDLCSLSRMLMPDQHSGAQNTGDRDYRIKHLPLERARTDAL